MGQKVHPNGIRLGIVKPWNSTWFAMGRVGAPGAGAAAKRTQGTGAEQMSNFFEQELRKLFADGTIIRDPVFVGRACLGSLGTILF